MDHGADSDDEEEKPVEVAENGMDDSVEEDDHGTDWEDDEKKGMELVDDEADELSVKTDVAVEDGMDEAEDDEADEDSVAVNDAADVDELLPLDSPPLLEAEEKSGMLLDAITDEDAMTLEKGTEEDGAVTVSEDVNAAVEEAEAVLEAEEAADEAAEEGADDSEENSGTGGREEEEEDKLALTLSLAFQLSSSANNSVSNARRAIHGSGRKRTRGAILATT